MPAMASVVEEFQRKVWLVHGRVPYTQAQPRTRTEQHWMLEKAAEAILLMPGIKVQVGIGGQLILPLFLSVDEVVCWRRGQRQRQRQCGRTGGKAGGNTLAPM